jgi:tetratricopeptide (TPR) repeat protein
MGYAGKAVMGRWPWIAGLIVAAVGATPGPGRAGFYDPAQPITPLLTEAGVRPLPYELFRDTLIDTLRIADPLLTRGLRVQFLDRRKSLLARGLGSLSPAELAELGAVQWRLRDADGAFTALRLAEGRDPRNFLVLTHLGTVHQAMGQLREAAPYLETARDFFPSPWPGQLAAAADWFRQAERYQLALLKLRLREQAGFTGRPSAAADVDALFPVRFVGPDGTFQPGTIADTERAKLPPDAAAVVQQLLLWFPEDTRLLWLLGELYNAHGDLASADAVFEECVWSRRYDSPTLRDHRRQVKEALAAQPKPSASGDEPQKPVLLPESWQLWPVVGLSAVVFLLLAFFQVREFFRRRRPPAA